MTASYGNSFIINDCGRWNKEKQEDIKNNVINSKENILIISHPHVDHVTSSAIQNIYKEIPENSKVDLVFPQFYYWKNQKKDEYKIHLYRMSDVFTNLASQKGEECFREAIVKSENETTTGWTKETEKKVQNFEIFKKQIGQKLLVTVVVPDDKECLAVVKELNGLNNRDNNAINKSSVVTIYKFKEFVVVQPGDQDSIKIKEILNALDVKKVDIYVIPHHGSVDSNQWIPLATYYVVSGNSHPKNEKNQKAVYDEIKKKSSSSHVIYLTEILFKFEQSQLKVISSSSNFVEFSIDTNGPKMVGSP